MSITSKESNIGHVMIETSPFNGHAILISILLRRYNGKIPFYATLHQKRFINLIVYSAVK